MTTNTLLTDVTGLLGQPVAREIEQALVAVAVPAILKGLGAAADAGKITTDVENAGKQLLELIAAAQSGTFSWSEGLTEFENLMQIFVDLEAKTPPSTTTTAAPVTATEAVQS